MRQHNIHLLLCDTHLASQIKECPVCVREERDRYRDALHIIRANRIETDHPARIARIALEAK